MSKALVTVSQAHNTGIFPFLAHPPRRGVCLVCNTFIVWLISSSVRGRRGSAGSRANLPSVWKNEGMCPTRCCLCNMLKEVKWQTVQRTPDSTDIKCCKISPFYVLCQFSHGPFVAGLDHEQRPLALLALVPNTRSSKVGHWAQGARWLLSTGCTWDLPVCSELPGVTQHNVSWLSSH